MPRQKEGQAKAESGLRAVAGGLAGAALTGSDDGFRAGAAVTHATGGDRSTIVPGIAAGMTERKLQEAFRQLLTEHGRTIPGVNIGALLDVPGEPVTAGH